MPTNLIEQSKSYLNNTLFNKASYFLDEKSEDLYYAADFILPTLLAGIIQKCDTDKSEANNLYNQIKKSSFNKITNFEEVFKGENSLVFDKAYTFYKNIFDDNGRNVLDVLYQNSNLHKESIFSLVKMIIPVLIKNLGRNIQSKQLDKNSFLNLINTQKIYIAKSVTADFMHKMVNDLDLYSIDLKHNSDNFFKQEKIKEPTRQYVKFLFGLAVLGIVLFTFYFLNKKDKLPSSQTENNKTSFNIDPLKTIHNTINNTDILYEGASKNELGKYIKGYEFLGELTERTLKDGTKLILFSNNGLNQLINHIEQDKPISKTTWYDLHGILVEKENATINVEKSKVLLDKLVVIMNTYKNISVKLGGEIDNEGDAMDNFNKSHRIAKETMNELIKRGISPNRLRFEGYGENYPIADNNTPEGRKLNQRISIRLTKK